MNFIKNHYVFFFSSLTFRKSFFVFFSTSPVSDQNQQRCSFFLFFFCKFYFGRLHPTGIITFISLQFIDIFQIIIIIFFFFFNVKSNFLPVHIKLYPFFYLLWVMLLSFFDSFFLRSRRGVMGKVLDCGLKLSKFKLHSRYFFHFRTQYFSLSLVE